LTAVAAAGVDEGEAPVAVSGSATNNDDKMCDVVLEVGDNEKILLVQGIDLEINVHDVPD
jgi:hypothetical protein